MNDCLYGIRAKAEDGKTYGLNYSCEIDVDIAKLYFNRAMEKNKLKVVGDIWVVQGKDAEGVRDRSNQC